MRVRESGMPEEALWSSFFDPPAIFEALSFENNGRDIAEFGCGYGTFTLPACQRTTGQVHAFDIDPAMIKCTRARAAAAGVDNLSLYEHDFVAGKTPLADSSVDYVMLFNILHGDEPELLLDEAKRIMRPLGKLGVIHWNYDPDTPRGPPMAIRPRPQFLRELAAQRGFAAGPLVDLPPYHYGFIAEKD